MGFGNIRKTGTASRLGFQNPGPAQTSPMSSSSKYASIRRKTTFLKLQSNNNSSSAPSPPLRGSSFKLVCLHDWWLTKPPSGGGGLAVAGFSSREGKAVRGFYSAVISKRCDTTTVETLDGFVISLVGFINSHQTQQNGFSREVCCSFHFGFPYNWEDFAVQGSRGELLVHNDCTKHEFRTFAGSWENVSQHSDDLPVTRKRDLLMLTHRESDLCVLRAKAVDDLFSCLSELEHSGIQSTPELNNASFEAVTIREKLNNDSSAVVAKTLLGGTPTTQKSAQKLHTKPALKGDQRHEDSQSNKETGSHSVTRLSITIGSQISVRRVTRSMTKGKAR